MTRKGLTLITIVTAVVGAGAAERLSVGLTRAGSIIEAYSVTAGTVSAPKVLVVGDAKTIRQELVRYESQPEHRRRADVIGLILPSGTPLSFPPAGVAYRDNPESHYIWRWIGMQAPDLVLIPGKDDFGLAASLSQNAVAGVGRIPARTGNLASIKDSIPRSEAHTEITRRITRTPDQILDRLLRVYGHDLPEVTYPSALALSVRLRLGQLAEVEQAVAPYRDGVRDSLDKATESHLAGHLLFAALAEQTGDARYIGLTAKAADLAARESLYDEMSDSVFMSCPLLAEAGKLTGNGVYFDHAVRHWKRVASVCLRPDAAYRHSPLNDAAWARGNAFPALGLALTLSNLPPDHPGFDDLVRAYQSVISVLVRNQDENGMWREVIDRGGVYSELSATAMIATAMLRGIRAGWLNERAAMPRVERAWKAVLARTADDGTLLDVCESTGKQRSPDDYLYRAASLGRDDRGGAMVLLFAAEMARIR